MTVTLQDGGLLFNGLNLMMTDPDPTYGYQIRVMVHNGSATEFGDPEAVIQDVQSQLQDGDLQRVDRYGNRTATLDLRIDAPGSAAPGAAVAYGQQALELAAGFTGWAELQWTSPMAGAETSVMEMTSAVVGKSLDLGRETSDGTRLLKVTIGARPFVRAATKDTFDAPAVTGSTTTTVDTGSATTDWSMLSSAPAAFHNLNPNPSFETNTTGWAASTGTTSITRFTAGGYSGTGYVAVLPSSTSARSYLISPAHVVTAGQAYFVLFGVRDVPNGHGVRVRWYSDASATVQIGPDWEATFGAVGAVWFARSFVTPVAPAGAIRMKVLPFAQPYSGSVSWSFDAMLVTETGTGYTPGYFDGTTTNTPAINYTWDGTANNSTSTATWTAPTLAVVSGAVQGTVYGRATASIRRNNTGITAAAMATLQYMRIRGTATAAADGQVSIADNGTTVTPDSYSYNTTTGAYEILLKRPSGFTTLDITFTRTTGTISKTSGLAVAVDQIDITDNPYSSGKVQTRQISIGGSQRTELSLSVLGLDAAGTTPVGLGEQALIHTAAKGTDGRAKFLDVRATVGSVGTPTADSTAVSGFYNTLSTTGTPLNFTFAATTLLPGNYLLVSRLMPTTTGNKTILFRGYVDPSTGDNVYDPPGGTAWKTTPLTVATTGYPAIAQNAWAMLPLGLLRLPPADLQDTGATITIQIAADTASVVRLDDVFLLNADVGQTTLVNTTISGGSYSAVRLDAATVDDPDPSVWVGVANGSMLADPTRMQAFEQHQAAPGLLQASTVTPGCTTTRLSGSFYRRNGHDMAPPGLA